MALRTTDKQVAEQKLRGIVREKQQEREGILPARSLREGASLPLSEHLPEFLRERATLGRGAKYVKQLRQQLEKLFLECSWHCFRDVSAASFQEWRASQRFSPKTLNEYLTSACAFLNWMEQTDRATFNPLRKVRKVETRGRATRERRALSFEELRRLVDVSEDRGTLYLFAVYTGLRRGEIEQIIWSDLHLDREVPVVQVRAATTKNKKEAIITLKASVADRLRNASTERGAERVFSRMPRMNAFRRDLAAAGITEKDEQGRVVDFHSLRKTTATLLTLSGATQREIMAAMRHSDMRLTANVYTDVSKLPISEAFQRIPEITPPQIAPQKPVLEGPSVSQPVPKTKKSIDSQAIDSETLDPQSPILSLAVQLVKMVRDAGFEPAGKRWNFNGLAGGAPQIAPQRSGLADEITEILTTWGQLPPEVRASILTLIRSSAPKLRDGETKRSAEQVPPEPRGLRGRGGERPLSTRN